MKPHFLYFLFAAAIILAACNPENKPGEDSTEKKAVSLKITAKNSLKWSKADKVSIFDGKSNNMFRSQGAGESAVLAGEAIQASVLYGLYPYNPKAALADKTISASIPDKQVIEASSYPNIAVAKTEDINSMTFTPIAGFLKIDIANDAKDIESIKVTSAAGETLGGEVSIDMSGSQALVTPTSNIATISATAFEEKFKNGGTYYIAVLPGTYKDGFIVFYTIKGETNEMSVSGSKVVNAGETVELGKINRPLTANEKLFLGSWQVSKWGSRAHDDPDGKHTWISSEKGVPLPETTKDDIVTFNADGLLKLYLGADNKAYNVAEAQAVSVELTGQETWSLEENSEKGLILKLSGNGFPAFLGDIKGLTTDYSVKSITPAEICLEYDQPENTAFFQIYLQPKGIETSSHNFKKGDFGLNAEVNEEMGSHNGPATTADGINWYLTVEMEQEFFIWKSWGGLQIGAGWHTNNKLHVKSMKLSAANVPGAIKAVSITTSHSDESNKKQAELSVKVGGQNFGSRKKLVNDMTKYTFTGTSAASGEIEINWKSGSEGLSYFIRSVEVIYQK